MPLSEEEIRGQLDGLLERRTADTRLTTMGAGSDDLDDGKSYLAATVDGGWHVPTWPSQYGGRDASPQDNALVGRVLREYVVPDLYPFAIGLGMVGPALLTHGTTPQRDQWLHDIASGAEIWCQMFSEPDAGSDVAAIATSAETDGDDYVINGTKTWISNGGIADYYVVFARTENEPGTKALSAIVVDKDTGFVGFGTTNPIFPVHISGDGTARRGLLIEQTTASVTWTISNFETGAAEGAGNFGINQVGGGNRFKIDTIGNVAIGNITPTTKLHVDGPIRCKSYTVATVPSATALGAGSQIYVSNETGGAVLAFSDGTNWRRVTDRAVVS